MLDLLFTLGQLVNSFLLFFARLCYLIDGVSGRRDRTESYLFLGAGQLREVMLKVPGSIYSHGCLWTWDRVLL